jgi:hypothetical protein
MYDDMRVKAVGSIGFAANQGASPGGVEIDLTGEGAVESSRRLQGSEKTPKI